MSRKSKHKKILAASVGISLLMHAFAIGFLQRYSLWFCSAQRGTENTTLLSLVGKKEKDEILKVSFDSLIKEERPDLEKPSQLPVASTALQPSHFFPDHPVVGPIPFQNSFPLQIHDFLAAHPVFPTFSFQSESFNLLEHLPQELIVPVYSKPNNPPFTPLLTEAQATLKPPSPHIEHESPPPPITFSETIEIPVFEAPQVGPPPLARTVPKLPTLPTLDELNTSSISDSFEAELIFCPKEEGEGYIFALTLIPKSDLELPRLRQHFTFLIDRSNTIQQGRLTATKAALHKALEELNPHDTFNIFAFDSKIEKMSPNPLSCTDKSFAIAEEFLDKIQLGSFFSTTDLYRPLFLTVPSKVESDELHTAILFTDGEALGKKSAHRSILSDWTQFNSGKVALYAIGLNGDNQMATLDVATAFNKGKLSNAPTGRGLKRKLLKLMKMIRNPIGKNISCKAISRGLQAKVTLYPKSSCMPNLYLDQPYVILGETTTLDDFILFVQGRLQDRWLNIKKTISFLNAKKGNKSLKEEWALLQAYQLYENYLIDEDPKHVAKAAALLEPFEINAAFR